MLKISKSASWVTWLLIRLKTETWWKRSKIWTRKCGSSVIITIFLWSFTNNTILENEKKKKNLLVLQDIYKIFQPCQFTYRQYDFRSKFSIIWLHSNLGNTFYLSVVRLFLLLVFITYEGNITRIFQHE